MDKKIGGWALVVFVPMASIYDMNIIKDHGFSFIEVVVTLAILAIGLTGIWSLEQQSLEALHRLSPPKIFSNCSESRGAYGQIASFCTDGLHEKVFLID